MALVIIYAVLSHFDFVAKFTVKNLKKDFTNTGRGGGGHHFMKVFHKTVVFFKRWLPLVGNFMFSFRDKCRQLLLGEMSQRQHLTSEFSIQDYCPKIWLLRLFSQKR